MSESIEALAQQACANADLSAALLELVGKVTTPVPIIHIEQQPHSEDLPF